MNLTGKRVEVQIQRCERDKNDKVIWKDTERHVGTVVKIKASRGSWHFLLIDDKGFLWGTILYGTTVRYIRVLPEENAVQRTPTIKHQEFPDTLALTATEG